jgi:hypothetical protein
VRLTDLLSGWPRSSAVPVELDNLRESGWSRGGGTGRRSGLKIPWPSGRAGSIPAPGTNVVNELRGITVETRRVKASPVGFVDRRGFLSLKRVVHRDGAMHMTMKRWTAKVRANSTAPRYAGSLG